MVLSRSATFETPTLAASECDTKRDETCPPIGLEDRIAAAHEQVARPVTGDSCRPKHVGHDCSDCFARHVQQSDAVVQAVGHQEIAIQVAAQALRIRELRLLERTVLEPSHTRHASDGCNLTWTDTQSQQGSLSGSNTGIEQTKSC